MTGNKENGSGRRWSIVVWGAAALLLLLPLVAMQFTDEVNWDLADFAVFGAMLVGACGTYELAARNSDNNAYKFAVGLALAAAFILIWMNLAVGIIGNENNPANLVYVGVLAIGIVGAIIARFRPGGMARAMFAMALAQALVALAVLIAGVQPRFVLVAVHGFFVALFVGSALFFNKAASKQPRSGLVSEG